MRANTVLKIYNVQVGLLDQEVKEGYVAASKEAVLNYIMLNQVPFCYIMYSTLFLMWNQEERDRLNILVGPKMWGPRVVRAPVPWHQSFLQVVEIVEKGKGCEGSYMDF